MGLLILTLRNGEVETYTIDEYPGFELTDVTLSLTKLETQIDRDPYILTLSEGSLTDSAGNKLKEINLYLGGTDDDLITSDADMRFITVVAELIRSISNILLVIIMCLGIHLLP